MRGERLHVLSRETVAQPMSGILESHLRGGSGHLRFGQCLFTLSPIFLWALRVGSGRDPSPPVCSIPQA